MFLSDERGFAFKSILVLTLICVVSAASLGAFHELTEERIKESEQKQVEQAFSEVFPNASFEVMENGVYQALEDGDLAGHVGIAKGRGYGGFTGGFIKLAVGIDSQGELERIRVISQNETPGLGSRITEDWFLKQFEGKSLEEIKLVKEGGEIDAITGATISSEAVVDSVREEIELLRTVAEKEASG